MVACSVSTDTAMCCSLVALSGVSLTLHTLEMSGACPWVSHERCTGICQRLNLLGSVGDYVSWKEPDLESYQSHAIYIMT